jgi:RNA polymerase sigma-70 factor (ECF subfamily)
VPTLARLAELSDAALIRRVRDGDEAGFRALYQRHTPPLYLLLTRLLAGNTADADDVLQDTWVACCRGLHHFRGDAAFSTWLTRIGIRTARGRMRLAYAGDDFVDNIAAPSPPFSMQTRIDLDRAIRQLPDHQRVILVLHDVEGFTHEEIADQLSIPVGTSKVTLSRARAAVRRLLSDGVPV